MAAYAALVSVMHVIDNLHLHHCPPISLHKEQVRLLTEKITSLQEFLETYNPNLSYSIEADPLEIRIADAAYAAEDVIETQIVDSIKNDGKKMSSDAFYKALEEVIGEMALIEKEAMEVKQTTVGVHSKSKPPDSTGSSSTALKKSGMVGADDALLEMKSMLTSDGRDLQIIPVIGMGGSGKTTLAISIYEDCLIKECFDIRAWATISQEYSLLEILSQLTKGVSQVVGVLGEMLHKQLYGRKYLIILDDMWSIEAWDGIRMFFPDSKNGSRIVVTTRLSNLASTISSSNSLKMELLDEVQSWELLSKTVFGEIGCPLELKDIGKKIGKSCKGLPLSIVVVGGLLAKSKQTREFWAYIEENLNSVVNLEDDERCLKILHTSYKHLPVHLKPCFLYMGVLPEDEVIRISRLVKLWVAEGFLRPISGKTLEEIARLYLKDLIDRNLVLIHTFGNTGNMKECKIHDLLRDLSLREAQKERFTSPGRIVNAAQRRVVFYNATSKNEVVEALSPASLVRSLTLDLSYKLLPPLRLRLLRTLNSPRFDSPEVHELVNSRFLDLSTYKLYEFPSSIWLFWNLQTLISEVTAYKDVTAPTSIWSMPHIRHVQFQHGLYLPDPPNGHDAIVLGSLQTLQRIDNFRCSEQVVKRIPNIKKLRLCYDEELGNKHCLGNLECLDKLESLRCDFSQGIMWRDEASSSLQSMIGFPHSLKKLTLDTKKFSLGEDMLDKIGALPLLEKLKLYSWDFRGGWETTEGQFRSLKFLFIGWSECLNAWTTESSHFPRLEQLHLKCISDYQLKEIPSDFAEISTLKAIDMENCGDSVYVSAKRILEKQEELYGDEDACLHVQAWICHPGPELESLAGPNFHFKWHY